MKGLQTTSFFYLSTPYTRYPDGISGAFVDAAYAASQLSRYGIPVFSPIVHFHSIAKHGGLDPLDHSIWMPLCEPFIVAASGLIIVKMPGWNGSIGLIEERDRFVTDRKAVFSMDWPGCIVQPWK